MKQTARIISTYSADTFGVCSALFELDGMVVMHDPSGCNSTYTTHDEPRWYDMDSRIYISGLTEYDAIMGDDRKLIREVVETAQAQQPRFIALLATPVPTMVGTDLAAVAKLVEKETGIPCFTLATNSMHFYVLGVSLALGWLAERACAKERLASAREEKAKGRRVNLLGVTPLDFAMNGSEKSMEAWLEREGFTFGACWARGASLDELLASGRADVNLVVSGSGLLAARIMEAELGIPYVVGTPLGTAVQTLLAEDLRLSLADNRSRMWGRILTPVPQPRVQPLAGILARGHRAVNPSPQKGAWLAIGDSVYMQALAAAVEARTGHGVEVICPVETDGQILLPSTVLATDEAELEPYLAEAELIIADPMYRPICPPAAKFVSLPHVGFSGRLRLKEIPNLVDDFEKFMKESGL